MPQRQARSPETSACARRADTRRESDSSSLLTPATRLALPPIPVPGLGESREVFQSRTTAAPSRREKSSEQYLGRVRLVETFLPVSSLPQRKFRPAAGRD